MGEDKREINHMIESLHDMAIRRDEAVAEVERLKAELELTDKLNNDARRVVDMFDCPPHGQCIPFAMEEIERLKAKSDLCYRLEAEAKRQHTTYRSALSLYEGGLKKRFAAEDRAAAYREAARRLRKAYRALARGADFSTLIDQRKAGFTGWHGPIEFKDGHAVGCLEIERVPGVRHEIVFADGEEKL